MFRKQLVQSNLFLGFFFHFLLFAVHSLSLLALIFGVLKGPIGLFTTYITTKTSLGVGKVLQNLVTSMSEPFISKKRRL